MALSVTFFPDTLTTNAVWYGCDMTEKDIYGWCMSDADIVSGRLENYDGDVLHPMMLPTLFAELERERLIPLSRANVDELVRRLHSLSISEGLVPLKTSDVAAGFQRSSETTVTCPPRIQTSNSHKSAASASSEKTLIRSSNTKPLVSSKKTDIKDVPTVIVWLRLSSLRNGLESWRAQLLKMIDHVEELERLRYGLDDDLDEAHAAKLSSLKTSGERITGRLRELLFENDEAARECTRAMEGMTLANQLVGQPLPHSEEALN